MPRATLNVNRADRNDWPADCDSVSIADRDRHDHRHCGAHTDRRSAQHRVSEDRKSSNVNIYQIGDIYWQSTDW
jgi:hypothetical protein